MEIVREIIIKNKPRSGGWEIKKVDCVATAGFVPCPLVQYKATVSLQVYASRNFLNCEVFNTSLSYVKRLCAALL